MLSRFLNKKTLTAVNAELKKAGYMTYPGDTPGKKSGYALNVIDWVAGGDRAAQVEVTALVARVLRATA